MLLLLFVFNDRNVTEWLRSRVKQYLRFQETPAPREAIESRKYGWIAKDLFSDPELAIFKWITEYRVYKHQALTYFSTRKEFTIINVTEDPNYIHKIKYFLSTNSFEYKDNTEVKSIRENTLNEGNYDLATLNHYYDLIDLVQHRFNTLFHQN